MRLELPLCRCAERYNDDCTVHGVWANGDLIAIRILAADPRVRISAQLYDAWNAGIDTPHVTLDGDVLKLRAVNQTVIYRIVRRCPACNTYLAEWPD